MAASRLRQVEQGFVFGDGQPFPDCHASSVAPTGDGDGAYMAVWFGGTHERHDDVGIWGARRHGKGDEWSAPECLAKVKDEAHWNPVLFAPSPGNLHLFFKVGRHIDFWQTWTCESGDGGKTWSAPRELVPGDTRGGRGPVKNKPIALTDGSGGAWLAGASLERGQQPRLWDVFVDRSEDNGRTWQATGLITLNRQQITGVGAIQPTLWESATGRVHMLTRSSCGFVCRSDSDDSGKTWSPLYKTDISNNNSGIDVARAADGALILAHNPVSGDWAERTPLRLSVSFDNGVTWPEFIDIETEKGAEFSYPSIIVTGREVMVTYTWKRRRIGYWRGAWT